MYKVVQLELKKQSVQYACCRPNLRHSLLSTCIFSTQKQSLMAAKIVISVSMPELTKMLTLEWCILHHDFTVCIALFLQYCISRFRSMFILILTTHTNVIIALLS